MVRQSTHNKHIVWRSTQRQPLFAYTALILLVLTLQFSPIVGLIGFRITGARDWSMIGIARDALVILLAAGVVLQSLVTLRFAHMSRSNIWAVVTLVALAALALNSTADIASVMLNLRRLLIFPLICFAVASAQLSQNQVVGLVRLILNTSVIVALFGVVEYFAPISLWRDYFRVVEFFSSNPLDPFGAIPFEESGRFFSGDFVGIFGRAFRRAVSTYLEPTTLAAGLIAGTCLAAAARRQRQQGAGLKLGLIVACGVLTLSKAYWLFLVAMLLYVNFRIPSPRRIFAITIAAGVLALLALEIGLTLGKFSHIAGLGTAIVHVFDGHPFGEGIGSAGNYAAEGSDLDIGAESGLGNLIAQVGVAALIYILWLQSLAADVIRRARARVDRAGIFYASMLLGWFISFLFSASSLGIGGNALVFLALSLYLHGNYSAPNGALRVPQ